MAMKKFIFLIPVILVSCVPWNIAPKCKIVAPENGSVFTRGDTIQVYVNANDDDGEIAEVRMYLDGIGIFSTPEFPYSYLLETAQLEVGPHELRAEAYDNQRKDATSEISFQITAGLPGVTTLQPVLLSGNNLVAGGTITSNGGGTIVEAGIMWSTEPYDVLEKNEVIATVTNNSFTVTLADLLPGTYYTAAYAENETGRSYGEVQFLTIPAPPTCEILEPQNGAVFARGDSIRILVDAMDDDGLIRIVRAYVDSKPIAASESFPYAFVYPTAGLSIGAHTLRAEAQDDSGIITDDQISFQIALGK
jgi:hypothetical protein